MYKIQLKLVAFLLLNTICFAQPYTDIASFAYQYFSSNYKNNPDIKNQTNQYSLNLFFPKEFNNGNVFLFRVNSELITSSTSSERETISSIALPTGFQFTSKNKKWKTVFMVIPKLASNFGTTISTKDWQFGGFFLENYMLNEKLKLKFGLYYNREVFGNFFVPLLGVDWKASERIYFYGTLPTNYKIEYSIIKNKYFIGLDYKWVTRSFNLSNNLQHDYIRFDETLLKLFAEGFIAKNTLLSFEVGYSFGKNPLQYSFETDELSNANQLYSPLKNYTVINFGISYRIRN